MPQLGAVRGCPQLSVPLSEPQFFPKRAQNAGFDSGVQAQVLAVPHEVPGPQVPQLATVRMALQLSRPTNIPHVAL